MQDIIRFHIPCRADYLKLVEDFALILGDYISEKRNKKFVNELKQVISDVFDNIVHFSNTAAQNEVVRFQFEVGKQFLFISIYDYGPGFQADQFFPPYPKDSIGNSYEQCKFEGGKVLFKVIDPVTVTFSLDLSKDENVLKVEDQKIEANRCLNLARITNAMDSVSYSYIGHGKYDWKLSKQL